jgi:hypothetical protein
MFEKGLKGRGKVIIIIEREMIFNYLCEVGLSLFVVFCYFGMDFCLRYF